MNSHCQCVYSVALTKSVLFHSEQELKDLEEKKGSKGKRKRGDGEDDDMETSSGVRKRLKGKNQKGSKGKNRK